MDDIGHMDFTACDDFAARALLEHRLKQCGYIGRDTPPRTIDHHETLRLAAELRKLGVKAFKGHGVEFVFEAGPPRMTPIEPPLSREISDDDLLDEIEGASGL